MVRLRNGKSTRGESPARKNTRGESPARKNTRGESPARNEKRIITSKKKNIKEKTPENPISKDIEETVPEDVEENVEIEEPKSDLHTVGYEIFKGVLKDSITQSVVSNCKKQVHRVNVISNSSGVPLQPENPTTKQFRNSVYSFLVEKYPKLTPTNFIILKSLPGCERQNPRTSYPLCKELSEVNDEYMPLGCIVGLMDGTKLYVWPNSIKDAQERTEILVNLEQGDVLVFRGDCVYAEANYEDYNYRVNVSLASPEFTIHKNETL